MKLQSITVGKYEIGINVEHTGGAVVKITASYGTEPNRWFIEGKLNHQGQHDHPEEQYDKDVNAFAQRLAEELAGKLRSEELAKKYGGTE